MSEPLISQQPPDDQVEPLARLFAGPAGLGRPRRRATRRLLASGAAAAVLVVAGVAVANDGASPSSGYRTATAGVHTVDQQLDAVATIEPVSQASVAFPVAGTVATVPVAVGDEVALGQLLATLETDDLQDTVGEAQATLDQAELALEKTLAGESVSGQGGGGTGSVPAGATNTTGISYATGSSSSTVAGSMVDDVASSSTLAFVADTGSAVASGTTNTDDELRAAQQAVLDAQQLVDLDLGAAEVALDNATAVCAALGQEADVAAAADDTPSTTLVQDNDVAACRNALQAVLDAQQVVSGDQAALVRVSDALTTLLQERADQPSSDDGSTDTPSMNGTSDSSGSSTGGTSPGPDATSGAGTGAGTGGGSTPSTADRTSGSGAGAGSTAVSSPSAEELIARQKAVDAAAAQLKVAEQAVGQAEVVSPIAGTVVDVNLASGDDVTAGSSTSTIVIVGDGGYEVSTAISVDDLPDVEVGQVATVVPDGSDTPIRGEVVAIGVAGTTSGSTTSYRVSIGLAGAPSDLGNGATASVSITTDAAADALAVPTSAVAVDGSRYTVEVIDGDETETTSVGVGAIGDTYTEITSGLESGQEIVLADLAQPLPSAATDSSSNAADTRGQGGPTGDRQFPGGGNRPGGGGRPGGN